MKTLIFKAAIAAVATIGISTICFAQTSFGIRAGVNFQNLNGKLSNGDDRENDLKTGFHVGVNAEIPVGIDFYIQPGVLFSTKGANYDTPGGEVKSSLSYIEVPVNFIYKPELGNGRIIIGFGPYAAYAISGYTKAGSLKVDTEFGDEYPETKPFDAGANLLAGYEFTKKLSLQLNAQLGLLNIYNRPSGDTKSTVKNTGFGVSLGYRF